MTLAHKAGGLTMDFRLRWHLWWEVLAKRWPQFHRRVLKTHLHALEIFAVDQNSQADLQCGAAMALLSWVLATQDWPEDMRDEATREQETRNAAEHLRNIRREGRMAEWLSTWMGAQDPVNHDFVIPRVPVNKAWDDRTRQWIKAAEADQDPPVWTMGHTLPARGISSGHPDRD